MYRVVVTGIGVVAPNGIGRREFCKAILEGRSGVGYIESFDTTGLAIKIAGEIRDFDVFPYLGEQRKNAKLMSRAVRFAVGASAMAVEDSGLRVEQLDPGRFGVCMGTGITPMDVGELVTPIHRGDSRPHAHAEPPRVELLHTEAGILDRHGRGTHGEPHRPAHQLCVLPILSQVGKDIEVPNLTGNLDREPRGVEALDVTDAGTPLQDRLAELAAANPVGSDHTYSGHDNAAHVALPPSFVALSGVQCGIPDP